MAHRSLFVLINILNKVILKVSPSLSRYGELLCWYPVLISLSQKFQFILHLSLTNVSIFVFFFICFEYKNISNGFLKTYYVQSKFYTQLVGMEMVDTPE